MEYNHGAPEIRRMGSFIRENDHGMHQRTRYGTQYILVIRVCTIGYTMGDQGLCHDVRSESMLCRKLMDGISHGLSRGLSYERMTLPRSALKMTHDLGASPVRLLPGYPAGLRGRYYPPPGPGPTQSVGVFGPVPRLATCPRCQHARQYPPEALERRERSSTQ